MTWNEASTGSGQTSRTCVSEWSSSISMRPSPAPSSMLQGACVRAIRGARAGCGEWPRSRLDGLVGRALELGAAGLVWMRVRAERVLESPVAKFLSESHQRRLWMRPLPSQAISCLSSR